MSWMLCHFLNTIIVQYYKFKRSDRLWKCSGKGLQTDNTDSMLHCHCVRLGVSVIKWRIMLCWKEPCLQASYLTYPHDLTTKPPLPNNNFNNITRLFVHYINPGPLMDLIYWQSHLGQQYDCHNWKHPCNLRIISPSSTTLNMARPGKHMAAICGTPHCMAFISV